MDLAIIECLTARVGGALAHTPPTPRLRRGLGRRLLCDGGAGTRAQPQDRGALPLVYPGRGHSRCAAPDTAASLVALSPADRPPPPDRRLVAWTAALGRARGGPPLGLGRRRRRLGPCHESAPPVRGLAVALRRRERGRPLHGLRRRGRRRRRLQRRGGAHLRLLGGLLGQLAG